MTATAHQISQEARDFAIPVLVFAIVLASGIAATRPAQAQIFEVIYSFQGSPDASQPGGAFVRDAAGNFFSTSGGGGTFGQGTVFKLSATGKESVLYSFCLQLYCQEGGNPSSFLIRDSKGNFYGTASGGTFNYGFVFEAYPDGGMTVLHNFTGGADGGLPGGRLLLDAEGNLYGTTGEGGAFRCGYYRDAGCGVVYRLSKTGDETVLYNFTSSNDWPAPTGGLVRDSKGNLYGMTSARGTYGYGTVFRLDPSGEMKVLHNFSGGEDGIEPIGSLLRDSRGNLYGETASGGSLGRCQQFLCGVVFKLSRTGKETVLHRFVGGLDGLFPSGDLVRDVKGDLYGTTYEGGEYRNCLNSDCGTVFKIDTKGIETVLYRFTGEADGGSPSGLIHDTDGTLYGATGMGGNTTNCAYGCGTAFRLSP